MTRKINKASDPSWGEAGRTSGGIARHAAKFRTNVVGIVGFE